MYLICCVFDADSLVMEFFHLKRNQQFAEIVSKPAVGFIMNHDGISVCMSKKGLFSWNIENCTETQRVELCICVRFRVVLITLFSSWHLPMNKCEDAYFYFLSL